MSQNSTSKSVRNYIRLSLILLIIPVLYLGLWASISGNETLNHFEKVQLFMSYFPEAIRNSFKITFALFGMCLLSAVLGFTAYQKSETIFTQIIGVVLSLIATLLTVWFGMTLM